MIEQADPSASVVDDLSREEMEAGVRDDRRLRSTSFGSVIRSPQVLAECGFGALAVLLATFAAFVVLQLWNLDIHVPMFAGGDINLNMAVIKNLDRGSWFYTTPNLGYPFGQQLYDYRSFSGDTFNLAIVKVLGFFTQDPAVISNAYTILTYPLVAGSAYLGSRLIRLRRSNAVLVAVVFALLPFHQVRNAEHMFYTNYSAIPLAIALAVRQAGPRPLLRAVRGAPLRGLLHRDTVMSACFLLVIGTSGSYFGAFSLFFLAFGAMLALLRGQRRSTVATVMAIVAVAGLMVVQTLPNTLYQRKHGENDVSLRSAAEFDVYPLRPAFMLLPAFGHRLTVVRNWRDRIPVYNPVEGSREALGFFGAVGFFLCCGLVVVEVTRTRRTRWARRLHDVPLMVIGAVLMSVMSGLSWTIGMLGFTQVRAWNRISIFVGFMCVALTALGLQQALRRRPRWIASTLLVIVGLAAVFDQTRPIDVPKYNERARQWGLEEDVVTAMETTLGNGAAVFQLPVVPYPEHGPVVGLTDYDQLFGYLHSDALRWSYGGMKGREADWSEALDPLSYGFVDDLLITGFTGLTINLAGYEDHGQAVADALAARGLAPVVQSDAVGGLTFYDLRPQRVDLDSRLTVAQQAARRTELLGRS